TEPDGLAVVAPEAADNHRAWELAAAELTDVRIATHNILDLHRDIDLACIAIGQQGQERLGLEGQPDVGRVDGTQHAFGDRADGRIYHLSQGTRSGGDGVIRCNPI